MARPKRWEVGAPLVAVALALAGCRASDPSPVSSESPRRIVSFVPAATQAIVRLGGAGLLAGRTTSDAGEEVQGLPIVGDVLTPNVERLASIEPDLIVIWSESDAAPFERALAEGGRIERIAVDRLVDVGSLIEDVGSWIDRPAAADALVQSFNKALSESERTASGAAELTVIWVVWADPITVAGPGSFVDDLLSVAGGRNAVSHLDAPWPQISSEALLALDPDVLVWPRASGVFPSGDLAGRRPWSLLRAVREERVVPVESDRYHVPGIHLGEAAVDLAESLRALENP